MRENRDQNNFGHFLRSEYRVINFSNICLLDLLRSTAFSCPNVSLFSKNNEIGVTSVVFIEGNQYNPNLFIEIRFCLALEVFLLDSFTGIIPSSEFTSCV